MTKINFLILVFCLTAVSCQNNTKIEKEYYPNGLLKSETSYKNGVQDGVTKLYDDRGYLTATAEYKNGLHEGWLINYTHGKMTAKAMYKNDEQHGPVTLYYTDGNLYRESKYVHGRVDSIVKTYYPNGKLQAENLFKMGKPAIGLKEYDENGKPITKHPTIVIDEINQTALLDKVLLKIHLSDKYTKVEIYEGELEEGKFLNDSIYQPPIKNGVVTEEIFVPRRTTVMHKYNFIVKYRTELGNTMVMQKAYNLAVSNR